MTSQKDLGKYIMLNKVIGKGSFATVYEGFRKKDKLDVAIKVIKRHSLNDKHMANLSAEIDNLRKIKNPHVVRLYDVNVSKKYFYLVMEFCKGGDLSSYMKDHGELSDKMAQTFLRQFAEGMKSLRQMNLVHRDLKPQNVLLSSKDPKTMTLKIADFGFAKVIEANDLTATMCGSPLYMAPEVLNGQKYGEKVDLWSIGCVLYQMLTGKLPFPANNLVVLIQLIEKGNVFYPDHLSNSAKDLIQHLLKKNPKERISFEDFFNHPYVNLNLRTSSSSSFYSSDNEKKVVNETTRSRFKSFMGIDSDDLEESSEEGKTSHQKENENQTKKEEEKTKKKTILEQKKKAFNINPYRDEDSIVSSFEVLNAPTQTFEELKEINFQDGFTLTDLLRFDSDRGNRVEYSRRIFDFQTFEEKQKAKNDVEIDENLFGELNMIENKCKRAFSIAEAALVFEESFQNYLNALVLYTKSLHILYITLSIAKECFRSGLKGSNESKNYIEWIRKRFVEFLERTRKLKMKISFLDQNDEVETPEQLLYSYSLRIAKDAALEDYIYDETSDICVARYERAKYLFEYILYDSDCKIQVKEKDLLIEYIKRFDEIIGENEKIISK